ncbi:hypothetical protein LCGC14_1158640 [marine sediment metagenome]|uniref:Uncharacterized protein n=1 Tax=marine sediment metagenome TaxID=412755 RepID=A0A0F9MGE2_9ZZZZ
MPYYDKHGNYVSHKPKKGKKMKAKKARSKAKTILEASK